MSEKHTIDGQEKRECEPKQGIIVPLGGSSKILAKRGNSVLLF